MYEYNTIKYDRIKTATFATEAFTRRKCNSISRSSSMIGVKQAFGSPLFLYMQVIARFASFSVTTTTE